ncbi:MAG: hypothetical protein NE330_18400 [Lentisphaeraceae bacterium]|nr:hypothetical protein [Lentisphaeraceae bacterium]
MTKFTVLILFLFSFTSMAQTKVESDIKAIKSYVIKLNKRVKALEAKVKELEEKLGGQAGQQVNPAVAPVQQALMPNAHRFSNGANKAALLAIQEPRVWNEQSVKNYLNEISIASANQTSYGSEDYQVFLIKKIPMEYAEVLIKSQDFKIDSYIKYSLPDMVRDQDKALVIKNLYDFTEFAKAVLTRPTWHTSAWPIMMKALKNKEYVDHELLQYVASKDRPDGNKALLSYFEMHGSQFNLDLLKQTSLRENDFKKSVQRMWKKNKSGDSYKRNSAALVAVQYGESEALQVLMKILKNPNGADSYTLRKSKELFGNLLDTNDDALTWYEANRRKIRFDERTKKYVAR